MEGLFKKKSEFVRTPKYSIKNKKDSWKDKKYVPIRISTTVVVEILLAMYCLFGVASSVYFLEIAAVPFQLLFFLGFAVVSIMSIRSWKLWVALRSGYCSESAISFDKSSPLLTGG